MTVVGFLMGTLHKSLLNTSRKLFFVIVLVE